MPDRFFELSVDLLCIASYDGDFLAVNPAWVHALGHGIDAMVGRRLTDFIHPDDRDRLVAETSRVCAGETTHPFDVRLVRKDGGICHLRWAVAALPEKRQLYAVAHDITDLKAAQEACRQMDARLMDARKFESLAVMAGAIAHEFNNILQVILGNAEAAQSMLASDSPIQRRIELILKSGQRATGLTRQMLACAGRRQPTLRCSDISALVQGAAPALQEQLPVGVELRLALANHLPEVNVDCTQIRQVIQGLVRNAAEAIGDVAGVVTVRTALASPADGDLQGVVGATNGTTQRYVMTEVSDTGCGMDSATRARIFEPFFSTKFLGRGLGLASALGIVRAHGGHMKVTSQPGEGTALQILLPVIEQGQIGAAQANIFARLQADLPHPEPQATEMDSCDHPAGESDVGQVSVRRARRPGGLHAARTARRGPAGRPRARLVRAKARRIA